METLVASGCHYLRGMGLAFALCVPCLALTLVVVPLTPGLCPFSSALFFILSDRWWSMVVIQKKIDNKLEVHFGARLYPPGYHKTPFFKASISEPMLNI